MTRLRVADRHGLDAARAIDEDADAAVQGVGVLGQLAGQVVGDDVVGGDAAAVEALDAVLFGRGEAQHVAVQLGNRALPPSSTSS